MAGPMPIVWRFSGSGALRIRLPATSPNHALPHTGNVELKVSPDEIAITVLASGQVRINSMDATAGQTQPMRIGDRIEVGSTTFQVSRVLRASDGADKTLSAEVQVVDNIAEAFEEMRTIGEDLRRNSVLCSEAERSGVHHLVASGDTNACNALSAGFERMVVSDGCAGAGTAAAFELDLFLKQLLKDWLSLVGNPLDAEIFHREDVAQLLKDERPSLICILNTQLIPLEALRQIRELTQDHHRVLFLSCGKRDIVDEELAVRQSRPENATTLHASGSVPNASEPQSQTIGANPEVYAPVGSDFGTTVNRREREQFALDELAIVLSHFDIGILESIVEYPRGSRKAPKLLVVSDQGKYLLKRRARGKDEPYKVAFAHAIQLFLAAKQFPLPHLIGTRKDNNSMLQWRNATYELFEYIPGQSYPHTLEATFDSGRVLALYHKLLGDFKTEWQPPTGSYHLAPSIERGLHAIPAALTGADKELGPLLEYLAQTYKYAADCVEELDLKNWPRQFVHADWHPGNMLFRDNRVVAVIDYDAARLLPRVIDVANGALQFSIIGGDDISKWPEYLDESRFKRFLRGYDEVMLLSEAEIKAIPWLMAEALIAEAVLPIAMAGTFGRMNGLAFLQMVHRKVYWLTHSADRLIGLAEG